MLYHEQVFPILCIRMNSALIFSYNLWLNCKFSIDTRKLGKTVIQENVWVVHSLGNSCFGGHLFGCFLMFYWSSIANWYDIDFDDWCQIYWNISPPPPSFTGDRPFPTPLKTALKGSFVRTLPFLVAQVSRIVGCVKYR